MPGRITDPARSIDRRKRRLLVLIALAVFIPSVALSWVTLSSVPRQAEARKASRLREAEKILEYHERDLEQLAQEKAAAGAKVIGVEALLNADPPVIRKALEEGGWNPETFESVRIEAASKRPPSERWTPGNPVRDEEFLNEAMAVAAGPRSAIEDSISLPTGLGLSGVLRFRFSHDYAHGTLLHKYFEREAPNPDSHWVLRAREVGSEEVLYESAPSSGEDFDVTRTLIAPSFRDIVLELRDKQGPIAGQVRRWALGQTVLILFLDILLGTALWIGYDNVRRELVLSRLKSDFVANVSHELKTPLALIRLFAETLEMGRVSRDGKAKEYYRIINKESQRLTQLINNILDFSRIEAGRKEYRFVTGDPSRVVEDVVESYRFPIEQQGFKLNVDLQPLPEIPLDPDALAQALINLVNNAIKYSGGEKEITIAARRNADKIEISVADRGIGIPRNEQKKIFEKFYRVESSLIHETKGSGLGLSLVRHIMDAHGGDVAVESAPGKGSTFTLVLPVRGAVEPAGQTTHPSGAPMESLEEKA